MGLWDTIKGEFNKGVEQGEDAFENRKPTTPSDKSDSAHDEAKKQASKMEHEVDAETLLSGHGASKCPIEVTDESEDMEYLLKTADVDVDGDDVGSVGYMLLTDERVIIAAMRILSIGVGTQHSISYHNISDISLKHGMATEVLEIRTPGHEYEITGMNQSVAEPIYNYIRQQTQQDSETNNTDPLDKLERLSDLRDEGSISEKEFQDKKSELIDQI